MPFPQDPLPLIVELFHSGVWNDITADVYTRERISILHGRPDEASESEPGSLKLELDNRTGKYSPRNPNSALFGLIGRNTPIRARVGAPQPGVRLSFATLNDDNGYVSAPREVGDDITGDMDLRIMLDTNQVLYFAGNHALARRYLPTGDQRAWAWWLVGGKMRLRVSDDGTLDAGQFIDAFSFGAIDEITFANYRDGIVCLRATLDADNGAGGKSVRFFTGPDLDGPFIQLGDTFTTAGTITPHASTADLEVGRLTGPGGGITMDQDLLSGVYGFQVRSGIDGTVINSFTNITPGETTFTDDQGSDWTIHGQAYGFDDSILFTGEVSNWPPTWDPSETDVSVPLVASGVLRRLRQGRKGARSSLFRGISDGAPVVAYWPFEDGADATVLASAFEGHPPGVFVGEFEPSSYTGFIASEPIATQGLDARWKVQVPPFVADDDCRVFTLVHVPADGVPSTTGQRLLSVLTTGPTVNKIDIVILDSGSLKTVSFLNETVIDDSGFIGFNSNGTDRAVTLEIRQEGANVTYRLSTFDQREDAGATGGDITITGRVYGRVREVHGPDLNEDLNGCAIGHVALFNQDVNFIWDLVGDSLIGHRGEPAGDRWLRLTAEEDLPQTFHGRPGLVNMGIQEPGEVLDLVAEPGTTDTGVFGEARDQLALNYRIGETLYNQEPKLNLEYDLGEIATPFQPVEDDQGVTNDVTVKRAGGSEERAIDTTTPMSVNAPPDGIGVYSSSVEVSVAADGYQLQHQARWRLHLGTVDQLRYPQVTVNLTHNPELIPVVQRVHVGDIIRINDLPSWLPPDDALLLVNRIAYEVTPFTYEVTFTCTPELPWAVGTLGFTDVVNEHLPQDRVRADTQECALDEALTTTETDVTVFTTEGPGWTTNLNNIPFDIIIGGEIMRVTAVANITSILQTFTVQRSINGVVKTHATGAAVRLAYPMTGAL